jgi:sulfite oxidase
LADVLEAAGVHNDDRLHVAFIAPDLAPEAVPAQPFGGSIPLHKAMSEEVLLAWDMNSAPLPRVHGGPVRVVVPGYIGARSVKWVSAITVQPAPSENYFQALDYRVLPPETNPDTVSPGEGISMSSLPLNCDILIPGDDDEVPEGPLTIAGWAVAGDGRSVDHVDVSLDEGRTWQQADLHPMTSRWAWRRWSLTVDARPGPLTLTARAWDDTGVTHPEWPASIWNPRGYQNNAWARVELTVTDGSP